MGGREVRERQRKEGERWSEGGGRKGGRKSGKGRRRKVSPFAMAYKMAMLLAFCPFTLRMGLFLVMISHTTMAKLKTSQRSV